MASGSGPSGRDLYEGIVHSSLRDRADEPIPVPIDGLVGVTGMIRRIEPFTIDANVLRNDVLRLSPTRITTAAARHAIRLYVASHVVDEVYEHLDEWASDKGVAPGDAWQHWNEVHSRLLVCIDDDSNAVFTGDESWRLHVLETSPEKRFGDPDDLPTAQLALSLAARLLSEDRAPLHAVYGHDHDTTGHRGWLKAVGAAGELGALHELGSTGSALAQVSLDGLWTLARRSPELAALIALAASALIAARTTREQRQAMKEFLGRVLELSGEVQLEVMAARAQLAELCAPRHDINELVEELGTGARARLCAWTMARSPNPGWTAASLSEQLPSALRSEKATREVLRTSPWFQQRSRGVFQLGFTLPQSANPTSAEPVRSRAR